MSLGELASWAAYFDLKNEEIEKKRKQLKAEAKRGTRSR